MASCWHFHLHLQINNIFMKAIIGTTLRAKHKKQERTQQLFLIFFSHLQVSMDTESTHRYHRLFEKMSVYQWQRFGVDTCPGRNLIHHAFFSPFFIFPRLWCLTNGEGGSQHVQLRALPFSFFPRLFRGLVTQPLKYHVMNKYPIAQWKNHNGQKIQLP